jgi:hypothetical protein
MTNQKKTDLFKECKAEYKAVKNPVLVDTTPASYLTIKGRGEPGGELFQECVGALYSMAFTVKMTRKANGLGDYVICKLECLLMSENCEDLSQMSADDWQWQLMIRTPDTVGIEDINTAATAILKKGKTALVDNVSLDRIHEGQCVQMLHVGPYDKEHETITIMKQYMIDNNLTGNGQHHEIYLSDPRRIPPERLKTILRLPVK